MNRYGRSLRHRVVLAGVTALALATTAACSVSTNTADKAPSAAAKTKSGSLTIGLANQQESVTFPAAIAKGAEAKAAELGVKLVDMDSQGDQAKQASQVQDLIAQKVDGILLTPLSPGPAQALVDQATAAGIPVGTVHGYVGADRKVEVPYAKLKFVLDENELGAGGTAGELALKALPGGGKVAVITGAAGFVENTTRVTKFKAALGGAGADKYTIVATQPGNWTKQDGQSACQNILAANPGIGLFYAISDDMAVGCAAAVKSAGSKAKIIGIGGSKGGIAAIKSGDLYGTVCYKPYDEGAMAVQMMHDALTGKLTGAPKTTFYNTPGVTAANVSSCTPQW
ncbi:sugar ABC transporter substrate-binding protein [Streptomyces sp. NBC_00353]|uniref:sugar ABC transporter substrate-binding protein n=1 Tax=Streptomyces sp. NBC_00353 TaxID=2975722 RepID=UPI002E27685D